jgi:hypothetical protein
MLNDPKVPFRYQPEETGPIFLLKVPTVADRVDYRYELAKAGVRRWSDLAMLDALADGVKVLLPSETDAQRESLLTEIEATKQRITDFLIDARDGRIDRQDEKKFAELWKQAVSMPESLLAVEFIIADQVPSYAYKAADREVFDHKRGLIAAKRFLIGWENLDAPFHRTLVGVPEEILAPLKRAQLEAIGWQIEQLLEPSQDALGNWRSGAGYSPAPTPSPNGTGMPLESIPSSTTTGPVPN